MENSKIKGNIRMRAKQLEIIVDAMEKNPFLNGTKLSSLYTHTKRMDDWQDLQKALNSSGGAVKSLKCWQKTWTDKKADVKKKYRNLKLSIQKTGGGKNLEVKLTDLEERILQLIGLDAAEGLDVEETEECVASTQEFPTSPGSSLFSQVQEAITLSPVINIQTPQTARKEDGRISSIKKRVRTKPLLLKSSNADKLVEGQNNIAKALDRCAQALEKRNELQERELQIKQQKADAFTDLFALLEGKFK